MKTITLLLSAFIAGIFLSSCSLFPLLHEGEPLKKLDDYSIRDFKFTKDIAYFEIEIYSLMGSNNHLQVLPYVGGRRQRTFFDQIAYQRLNNSDKSRINALPSHIPKTDHLVAIIYEAMAAHPSRITALSNLRYLDNQSNAHAVSTNSQLKDLLGEIDTAAEIQLVLWMNKIRPARSYKKKGHHYEIITHYYNDIDYLQACGTYTYSAKMDFYGKIFEYKLLKCKKPTEDDDCSPV